MGARLGAAMHAHATSVDYNVKEQVIRSRIERSSQRAVSRETPILSDHLACCGNAGISGGSVTHACLCSVQTERVGGPKEESAKLPSAIPMC
jgi:hypothetical protein